MSEEASRLVIRTWSPAELGFLPAYTAALHSHLHQPTLLVKAPTGLLILRSFSLEILQFALY